MVQSIFVGLSGIQHFFLVLFLPIIYSKIKIINAYQFYLYVKKVFTIAKTLHEFFRKFSHFVLFYLHIDPKSQKVCSLNAFCRESDQSPNFQTFMEPRNRIQGINSASLWSPAGRYDNTKYSYSVPRPHRMFTNSRSAFF